MNHVRVLECDFTLGAQHIGELADRLLADENFRERVLEDEDANELWQRAGSDPVKRLEACLRALLLEACFDEGSGDIRYLEHAAYESPYGHWTWVFEVFQEHFVTYVKTGSFLRINFSDDDYVVDWVFEDDGHCGYLWDYSKPVLREYDVLLTRGEVVDGERDEDVCVSNRVRCTVLPGGGAWGSGYQSS